MDHLADIKKYAKSADEDVIANMEKTYRLVMSKPDSAMVSEGDKDELVAVRESFVKKKLGVTDPDAEIDAVVQEVVKQIPGRNSRLTVYYLLAERYGKLGLFR